MSLLSTMQSDRDSIFLNSDGSPHYRSAVYTPKGGVAQPAVDVIFSGIPTHGDEYGVDPVEWEKYVALGSPSDVSGWKKQGTVTIGGTDYGVISAPYPRDTLWSVIPLRLPLNSQTRI
jgi:hypothetical protein